MAAVGLSWSAAKVSQYCAVRVPKLQQGGRRWRGPCPIHHGKHDSFSIDPAPGLWFCFSKCGRGGDIIKLEQELCDSDFLTARRRVYEIIGRRSPPDSRRSWTREEQRRFAQRRKSTRNLAESAGRWHRATIAELQLKKQNEIPFSPAWFVACRDLVTTERLHPWEVLEAYVRAAQKEPEETTGRVKWAEGQERECAQMTAIGVLLIAAAEDAKDADKCD